MKKEVWIVENRLTAEQVAFYAADGVIVKEGQIEYMFSDGVPGERGSSSDYFDLAEGLKDHSGYIVHYVDAVRPDPDQPGMFLFDGADISYPNEKEALAAYEKSLG